VIDLCVRSPWPWPLSALWKAEGDVLKVTRTSRSQNAGHVFAAVDTKADTSSEAVWSGNRWRQQNRSWLPVSTPASVSSRRLRVVDRRTTTTTTAGRCADYGSRLIASERHTRRGRDTARHRTLTPPLLDRSTSSSQFSTTSAVACHTVGWKHAEHDLDVRIASGSALTNVICRMRHAQFFFFSAPSQIESGRLILWHGKSPNAKYKSVRMRTTFIYTQNFQFFI